VMIRLWFVGQRVEQPICHGSEGRQLFEIA
jgi:hypothetical protein